MKNNIKISYEALLSGNLEKSVISDLRGYISIVHDKELKSFPKPKKLDVYLQELCVRLYNGALEKYDPSKGEFMVWLYTVVKNMIFSYHTHYEVKSEYICPVSFLTATREDSQSINSDEFLACLAESYRDADTAEKLSRRQAWKVYEKFVPTLTPKRQKVIRMYFHDIPGKEIARRLSMTPNAVNACVCRAKKDLKMRMATYISEYRNAA